MKSLFRLSCVLLILTLLAGCAAGPVLHDGRLAPPSGQAYVLVSVTFDSFNNSNSRASILLQGEQIKQRLETSLHDRVRAPGQEADADGHVFLMLLPAGKYQISEIAGERWEDSLMHPHMLSREQVRFPLEQQIELHDGEVLYLGNYHLSLNYRPEYRHSNTLRRDLNDLHERQQVSDFSNIRPYLP